MPRVRVRRSAYIFKWLVFLAVIALGIWWTMWLMKKEEPREQAPVVQAEKPPVRWAPDSVSEPDAVSKETSKPKAKKERVRAGTPPATPTPTEVAAHDFTPAPQPAREPAKASEPALGIQEETEPAKAWVAPQDATYLGKVVACEGQKYDQSSVMGGDGTLNYFYLCLDVGNAFTRVKTDNLMNPVTFSYKGAEYRAVQLRKNDVVRVRVNDGQALKVEMVKSVRD